MLLGLDTHRLGDDLALFQYEQRGNADDPEFLCQLRRFIHIDLADLYVGTFLCHLVENGGKHPARAAPICPKVQQDDLLTF